MHNNMRNMKQHRIMISNTIIIEVTNLLHIATTNETTIIKDTTKTIKESSKSIIIINVEDDVP